MRKLLHLLTLTTALAGCSLTPDFKLPDLSLPASYKEQPTQATSATDGKKATGNPPNPWKKPTAACGGKSLATSS